VSILAGLKRRPSEPLLPLLIVGLMLGMLILGQTFGPRPATYLLTDEGRGQDFVSGVDGASVNPSSKGRIVSFYGGRKSYELEVLPHIGPVDAPHVMVKFFDYTCNSCRDMHGDLEALQAAYPGQVAVILLPCPLNRKCNPGMLPEMSDHQDACEIAKTALAVWRADPEVFERFHNALFAEPDLSAAAAEHIALRLISPTSLESAMKDPWINDTLRSDLADFSRLVTETGKMPKLLITNQTVMHGQSPSTEKFVRDIGAMLSLESEK
jgi:hypothetical protein